MIALKEFIAKNLAKRYIRPSRSLAGSPILFIPKKNSKLRLYVDYRLLNDITIKNRYSLPLIESIKDQLFKAFFFTALNLKETYNLIQIIAGKE